MVVVEAERRCALSSREAPRNTRDEHEAPTSYDFGVYEESFCAVGTQGAFQLRHAKKYKLWEHTL